MHMAAFGKSKVVIQFADSYSTDHYLSKEGCVWWMERVEELSLGDIEFQHFPAQQLVTATDSVDKISDLTVDAGTICPSYVADKLPLNTVVMLPGLARSAVATSSAYQEMLQSGPIRDEFLKHNIVPIMAVTLPAYQLILTTNPKRSLPALEGLKIRSAGGTMDLAVRAVGGQAVSMPAPEIHMAMQKGALDGTLITYSSALSYHLEEVIQSASENGSFGTFALTIGMNKSVFYKLTPRQQAIILRAGEEASRHLASYMDRALLKDKMILRRKNIVFFTFPEEEIVRIYHALYKVEDQWIHHIKQLNLPAEKILAQFKSLMQ